MATLIIHGTKFETDKTLDVLKSTFQTVNKKTSYTSEIGLTSIIEVKEDEMYVNNFTSDEILKSLSCCTNIVRDCLNCSYCKVSNCNEKLQLDAAIVISKMLNKG